MKRRKPTGLCIRTILRNSVANGSKLMTKTSDGAIHLNCLTDEGLGDLVGVAFNVGLRTGRLQREPTDFGTVLTALHVAPVRDDADLNTQMLRQQLYAVFRSGFAVGTTQRHLQEAQNGL